MKQSKGQKGASSPLLVILIVVLVAVIGFAAWRIWDDRKSNQTTTEVIEVSEEVDVVEPSSGLYSVVLPADWVSTNCEDKVDVLFMAPSQDLLGQCDLETLGTTSFTVSSGDTRQPEGAYNNASYDGVSYDDGIDVNGLPGVQVAYVAVAPQTGIAGGNSVLQYQLYNSDTDQTYTITYQQQSGASDNFISVFLEVVESFELSE